MADIRPAAIAPVLSRAPSFLEVYANGIGVRLTPNDLGLVFSRVHSGPNGQTGSEEQVAVSMSPQTFKTLALTAIGILEAYESTVGEIFILTDPDLAPIKAAFEQLVKNSKQQQQV